MEKDKNLRRNIGITYFQYMKLFEEQNGKCAICELGLNTKSQRPQKGEDRDIFIAVADHCHTTGEVRGLLCHHCNVAIGHVKDSPYIAQKMSKYLEKTAMFTIVTRDGCTFCEDAKSLLLMLNYPFKESKLDDDAKKKAFTEAGFTTVPQIYYNGSLIGGFTDLRDTIRSRFEGASFVR